MGKGVEPEACETNSCSSTSLPFGHGTRYATVHGTEVDPNGQCTEVPECTESQDSGRATDPAPYPGYSAGTDATTIFEGESKHFHLPLTKDWWQFVRWQLEHQSEIHTTFAGVPQVAGPASGPGAWLFNKLFGGGSWMTKGQYLRIGVSRMGGNYVFRASGEWIEALGRIPFVGKYIVEEGHIIFKD